MTQQEMEAQALAAAVDILYCMYDREEPNYTTDKIATLMSEAYKAGKAVRPAMTPLYLSEWMIISIFLNLSHPQRIET